jgi:methyltransferase-like protein
LRHQIQQEPFIVNLLHQNVHIEDPLARFMISYLDGQTDRAALLSAVEAELTQGRLVLPSDGQSLRERIEANLHKMAKMALLQRE